MSKTEEIVKIALNFEISKKDIQDALISAIEGGSNYWMRLGPLHDQWDDDFYELPFNGKYIQIVEHETGDIYNITYDAIYNGLNLMIKNSPKYFARHFLTDQYDSETADVFLQYCSLGKLVYG